MNSVVHRRLNRIRAKTDNRMMSAIASCFFFGAQHHWERALPARVAARRSLKVADEAEHTC